ncbi:IS110 family transposase, partial [Burkholderia diffusa]
MSQPVKPVVVRMGTDIGKSAFHVVGLDFAGKPVFRNRFTRESLIEFLARASPTVVGMEACPGSNWLARKAALSGHEVRIVPAQFDKPFVKSNKTDMIDAETIAEAISRPTMRFAQPKT